MCHFIHLWPMTIKCDCISIGFGKSGLSLDTNLNITILVTFGFLVVCQLSSQIKMHEEAQSFITDENTSIISVIKQLI